MNKQHPEIRKTEMGSLPEIVFFSFDSCVFFRDNDPMLWIRMTHVPRGCQRSKKNAKRCSASPNPRVSGVIVKYPYASRARMCFSPPVHIRYLCLYFARKKEEEKKKATIRQAQFSLNFVLKCVLRSEPAVWVSLCSGYLGGDGGVVGLLARE
jgi:hypothetical protein